MPRRLLISFIKYAGFGAIAGIAFFAVGLLVVYAFTSVDPGTVINPTFGPTEGNVVLSQLGGGTGNMTMPGNGIWNSSGSVGINTPTPSKKLEVNGDAKVVSLFTEHAVLSGNTDISGGFANLSAEGTNRSLSLQAGAGRIWINRNGNIGIGTTTPAKDFDVYGETRIYHNGDEPALLIGKGTGGGNTAVLRVLGDTSPEREVFRITRGGSVCINNDCKNAWPSGGSSTGGSSTLSKLQITSPASDVPSVANANLYIKGSDQGYGLAIGTRITTSNQNGGVWLQGMVNDGAATPSNILLNQLGGNVGIGTDKPNKQLHVKTASGNAEIDIQSASSPYWAMYQDDATDQLRFWNEDGDNRLTLTKEGNVGIGTSSPLFPLHLSKSSQLTSFLGSARGTLALDYPFGAGNGYQSIDFSHNGSAPFSRIASKHTNGGTFLSLGTSNNYGIGITNEAITIDPNGNVGIGGTTISQVKLRIVGQVRLEGLPGTGAFLCINGNNDVVRQATPCQ